MLQKTMWILLIYPVKQVSLIFDSEIPVYLLVT